MILATDVTIDPSSPLTWFNLGLLGVFAWAGVKGLIWLRPAVEALQAMLIELRAINSELRAENKALNAFTREAVVPAITIANALSKESTETLRETQELMRLLIEELKRRQEEAGR